MRNIRDKLIDELPARVRGGSIDYEAAGLDSNASLTDGAVAVAASYTYDSFGNLTGLTGTVTNPFRYTAREFDSETGLYFYRARYYAPKLGRFLSEDPLRFSDGVDFFSYVGNRVTTFNDSLGLYKLKGFPPDRELEMNLAIQEVKAKLTETCCAGDGADKLLDLLKKATFVYKLNLRHCGQVGMFSTPPLRHSLFGLRNTIGIDTPAFDPGACGKLECTIIHEISHLRSRSQEKAERLERDCFGCRTG